MKKLVIDIETVGMPWEEHDSYVREYLIKGMNEAEAEEEKRRGALSPFTGRIVAIGVVNAETGRSCAMYEVPGQTEVITVKDGNRTMIPHRAADPEKFWSSSTRTTAYPFTAGSSTGRFLMIGRPSRDGQNATGRNRYRFHPNCDLRKCSTHGTITRADAVHLDLPARRWHRQRQTDGMDGRAVETLYRAGRHEDIALYCLEDVRATCELYLKLEKTLLQFEMSFREAEERAARRKTAAEQLTLVQIDEPTFMEQVTMTSLTLTEALDAPDAPPAEVVTGKHQALVLEKLAGDVPEDDI